MIRRQSVQEIFESRVHRINERIAVESYLRAVRFYAQFLQNAAG